MWRRQPRCIRDPSSSAGPDQLRNGRSGGRSRLPTFNIILDWYQPVGNMSELALDLSASSGSQLVLHGRQVAGPHLTPCYEHATTAPGRA